MGSYSYRNYEAVRDASVNRNDTDKTNRAIKVERRKKARRAYRIQGAILAAVVMVSSYLAVPKVADAFSSYENDSYTAGYVAVGSETHRTEDFQHFWFDYADIADSYGSDLDFDSFVYGTYNRIAGSGSGRTMVNMNDLFYQFYLKGLTPYSSFEDYCFAHGFTKEKDGKLVVDLKKYQAGAKEYLKELQEIEEHQENVNDFRRK